MKRGPYKRHKRHLEPMPLERGPYLRFRATDYGPGVIEYAKKRATLCIRKWLTGEAAENSAKEVD